MRPIEITLQAFGSYGKETTIDFSNTQQNLFLISGDTGSGKTTIFDAMVFALYGESSSGDADSRKGVDFHSHFTNAYVEPYVKLTFEENGKKYVVKRTPKHYRPSQRGEARDVNRLETLELQMPEGNVLDKKAANAKLVELVGLNKSQFMQVAMIAQGEFMRLLKASTKDRVEIFRKLFKTEVFQRIVDTLETERKKYNVGMDKILASFMQELEHVMIPEGFDAQELQELKNAAVATKEEDQKSKKSSSNDEKTFSSADLERTLELLSSLHDDLKDRLAVEDKALKEAETAKNQAFEEHARAKELKKAFEQRKEAEQKLQDCEGEAEAMIEAGKRADEIAAAYEIKDKFALVDAVKKNLDDAQRKLADENSKLPDLKANSETKSQEERNAEKVKEDANKTESATRERVQKVKKVFEDIKNADAALARALKVQQAAAKSLDDERQNLETYQKQITAWREEEQTLVDVPAQLAKKSSEAQRLATLVKSVQEVRSADRKVQDRRQNLTNAQQAFASKQDEYNTKAAAYQNAFNAYMSAQAGILAKELKAGLPCPVCGSTSHPTPCVAPDETPDWKTVEKLQKEADNLRNSVAELSSNADVAKNDLTNCENQAAQELQKLREGAVEAGLHVDKEATCDAIQSELGDSKKALDSEIKELEVKSNRLADLRRSLQGVDAKLQELEKVVGQKTDEAQKASNNVASCEGDLKSLKSQSTEYSTPEDADRALQEAKKSAQTAREAYEAAKTAASKARTALDQTTQTIADLDESIPKLTLDAQTRQKEYEDLLKAKETTEDAWRSIVKEYSREHSKSLRDQLNAYNAKKAAAEAQKKSADDQIKDRPEPQPDELLKVKEETNRLYDVASKRRNEIENALNTNKGINAALRRKFDDAAKNMIVYNRINSLYARLSGKRKGERMGVETFVQRYYMKHVLHAANRRFRDMSAGQFELIIRSAESASEGAKDSGLDLMVYSNVTGKEREIHTLSGGESFMAALALALGMADEIQMRHAAVNLDVMFIDEGFGSLDDYSRGQAIKVLKELANGSKLIGVISHVNELKREIEDQLVVTKTAEGSKVEWRN